jgi:hypothetical protein
VCASVYVCLIVCKRERDTVETCISLMGLSWLSFGWLDQSKTKRMRGTKKKHVEREKNQSEETADGISRVRAKY